MRDSSTVSIVQPLAITFDCGHCPKGLFGVLLHCILTQEKQDLDWSLDIDKIFRDQVSFDVGPYNETVTIKFLTTHLEILFSPEDVAQRDEAFSFKKICNMIRCTVLTGIEQARKSLHYSEAKTKHSLGIVCSECDKVHKVTKVSSQHLVKCLRLGEGYQHLPHIASFWFGGEFSFSLCYAHNYHEFLLLDLPTISFPEISAFSLREGSNHEVDFVVISDPSLETQHTLLLSKDEGSICHSRVHLIGNKVFFRNVKRIDTGRYTITSFNAAGQGKGTFQLRVCGKSPLYGLSPISLPLFCFTVAPTYTLEPDYLKVPAGSSPCVTFTVTSDPPLPEDVGHTLSKRGGGEVSRRFKVQNNQITFHDVGLEDRGQYIVSCCNEDGDIGEGIVELAVTPVNRYSSQQHMTSKTSKEVHL